MLFRRLVSIVARNIDKVFLPHRRRTPFKKHRVRKFSRNIIKRHSMFPKARRSLKQRLKDGHNRKPNSIHTQSTAKLDMISVSKNQSAIPSAAADHTTVKSCMMQQILDAFIASLPVINSIPHHLPGYLLEICRDAITDSSIDSHQPSSPQNDAHSLISNKIKTIAIRRKRPREFKANAVDDPNFESTLRFLKNNSWVEDDIPLVTEYVTQIINELNAIYEQCDVDGLKRFIYKDKYKKTPNQEANQDSDTSDDALSPHKKFLQIKGDARKYQTAMVELAKQRNTIVTLGTGQGKTLIAMMTIRHFRTKFPNKQTWFLVPTVALALQQADALKVNLPYKVRVASSMVMDTKESREKMRKADVLVATHGSALDLLRHYGDKFHLSRVNLLVLDECHNATKQHNYAVIMDTFYHTLAKDMRPHVLGLTASPIINIRKQVTDHVLEELLGEIESKLDSRLISLSSLGIPPEESGVIEAMVEETVVYYQNNVVEIEDEWPNPSETGMDKDRIREIDQLKYLFEELGPLVVHNYCQVLIKEISRNLFDEETPAQFDELLQYLKAVIDHCKMIMDNKLVYVSKKLEELELLLIDLIRQSESTGILFVDRRITAVALKNYFLLSPRATFSLHVRCDVLTASTTHIFKASTASRSKEDGKEYHEQWLHSTSDSRSVLNRLRRKELDLLICTSLVEEGVDIEACSFVIVFDNLKTIKSYTQYKGRARKSDSRFIVFEDLKNPPPITLLFAQKVESHIKAYIGRRNLAGNMNEWKSLKLPSSAQGITCSEEAALNAREYRTVVATVDINSAKNIVNRYALSIPRDISARASRDALLPYLPVYGEDTLLLPSHLPQHIRMITLPSEYKTSNKLYNESLMALIACVRLHQLEALNDRLLPLTREDMMDRLMEVVTPIQPTLLQSVHLKNEMIGLSNSGRKGLIYPIFYECSTFQYYDDLLQSDGRTLGLFCLTPLSGSFLTFFKHGLFGEVLCRLGDCQSVSVNEFEWTLMTLFYEIIFNFRWRRRTGHKRLRYIQDESSQNFYPPYVVVPLTKDQKLDYQRMRVLAEDYLRSDEECQKAARDFKNEDAPVIWTPIHEPNTFYVCYEYSGLTCSSSYTDDTFRTFHQYFMTKWSIRLNRDCPLIRAHPMWHLPRTMNDEASDEQSFPSSVAYVGVRGDQISLMGDVMLPRDGCSEAPIHDASLILHSTFLPQVLYSIERHEVACKFVEYCDLNIKSLSDHLKKIPLDLVLEALTAKSCSLTFNYDRLEYLGDAVLKLIQTDSLLYSSNMKLQQWLKCLHEGDLSSLRSAMGCNDRLKYVAEINGIDRFILLRPLENSQWLPSQLLSYHVVSDDGSDALLDAQPEYKPSDKVKADVIESLIGLVYLNTQNGFQSATTFTEVMGLAIVQDRTHDESTGKNRECILSDKLLQTVNDFLGIELKHSSLIKEAITHPTVLHSEVPSYQRLEWVGDAVLCLAAREWLYTYFPQKSVKELVPIEHTIVSNEAFGWVGLKGNIHKHIEYCDSSFPGRFEEYTANIESCAIGIWGSRPPKVIADVVEALIGVAHTQGGVSLGQQCAQYILTPITSAILRNDKLDETSHYELMHPQQLIMQLCPAAKVRAIEEDGYSGNRLWLGPSIGWHDVHEGSYVGPVGHVTFYGVKLIAATDKSSRIIAKNRACSILANIFLQNPTLTATLGKLSHILQQIDESESEK